ncbi:receptor-like protein 12, partial [Prunus avium]|uniref:Receptor-like protein 12 n=1 Tax=Prunus avium TaxID=42229 RepID=A0A6P5RDR6_PRUAV
ECDLFGEFPVKIFSLQNLEVLSVRYNQDLTGYLPKFNRSSPLVLLKVGFTSFFGTIPSSIEKLNSLQELDVAQCNFSNSLVPSALGNLTQLTYLDISKSNFGGPIPDSLANLTQLTVFRVSTSSLTGPIPSWLGNFSKLVYLDFAFNNLMGSIPASFSNLTNLEILYLQSNNLSGVVEFQMFHKAQNLYQLQLSWNNFEFVTGSNIMNATLRQFTVLALSSCNLKEFPYFLQNQTNLERLDLAGNKIGGEVPNWMWNNSMETLVLLDISGNLFSGELPAVIPWVNLICLRLSVNTFHGRLPIPPPSLVEYGADNNNFTGKISPLLCNMSSLRFLDLSKNNLSGMLPQCLGNFSDGLMLLLLGSNSFHGMMPQSYNNRSDLRMIDVSHNQLQGQLPRSLANCVRLEYLVLSDNQFSDVFPIWLGTLPELKLLAMRHNRFNSVIGQSRTNVDFPKLRILDLSYNSFKGEIPPLFPDIIVNKSTYMYTQVAYDFNGFYVGRSVDYSITLAIKGLDLFYSRVREGFAAIDISNNKFEGKIPEFTGNLKELRSLNISSNILTGSIPSSLGNLRNLESLDLSYNKLSGQIPQQLTRLTFLGNFDVSHNNLTGPIPQGTQLTSLNSTSYEGNPGLCGDPLPKCGNQEAPQPPPSTKEDSDSGSAQTLEFDLKFCLAGIGSGFVVGVVLADVAITRRQELFLKIVGMWVGTCARGAEIGTKEEKATSLKVKEPTPHNAAAGLLKRCWARKVSQGYVTNKLSSKVLDFKGAESEVKTRDEEEDVVEGKLLAKVVMEGTPFEVELDTRAEEGGQQQQTHKGVLLEVEPSSSARSEPKESIKPSLGFGWMDQEVPATFRSARGSMKRESWRGALMKRKVFLNPRARSAKWGFSEQRFGLWFAYQGKSKIQVSKEARRNEFGKGDLFSAKEVKVIQV